MHRQTEKEHRQRAVDLGNSGDPSALPELAGLAQSTAAQVRRLSASAIGKLAGLADDELAVCTLTPLLRDSFPQVRIEYWGMDTADYKIGMLKKQQLYQQQGKRLISLYPDDKPRIAEILHQKLTATK